MRMKIYSKVSQWCHELNKWQHIQPFKIDGRMLVEEDEDEVVYECNSEDSFQKDVEASTFTVLGK